MPIPDTTLSPTVDGYVARTAESTWDGYNWNPDLRSLTLNGTVEYDQDPADFFGGGIYIDVNTSVGNGNDFDINSMFIVYI